VHRRFVSRCLVVVQLEISDSYQGTPFRRASTA